MYRIGDKQLELRINKNGWLHFYDKTEINKHLQTFSIQYIFSRFDQQNFAYHLNEDPDNDVWDIVLFTLQIDDKTPIIKYPKRKFKISRRAQDVFIYNLFARFAIHIGGFFDVNYRKLVEYAHSIWELLRVDYSGCLKTPGMNRKIPKAIPL